MAPCGADHAELGVRHFRHLNLAVPDSEVGVGIAGHDQGSRCKVFVVSRVAEARRSSLGEAEAVVEGLAKTGPVISSAAAIMIVVFGGFTLGDFVLVKMLGFALATAVFLDAAIVRVAIGPALLVLVGRWNWWPGGG